MWFIGDEGTTELPTQVEFAEYSGSNGRAFFRGCGRLTLVVCLNPLQEIGAGQLGRAPHAEGNYILDL